MQSRMPIPSKCVFTLLETHLHGAELGKTWRQKRPCQNRQLLAAQWSISAGSRRLSRRYFSSRERLNGKIVTKK